MERQEVISFIKSHLLSRTEFYRLYSQIDDLTGGARLDNIDVIDINFEMEHEGRTDFSGVILVEAVNEVGIRRISFTGTFEGFFDELGVCLESAALDVST